MDALRLENGNTLISDFDNHRLLEVQPDGSIAQVTQGFDHPFKLTPVDDGILVADSDHRRLVKWLPDGSLQLIRENLNYVKSTAYLPDNQLTLALIEARYEPPASFQQQKINQTTSTNESSSFFKFLFNPYLLLITGLIIWGVVSVSQRNFKGQSVLLLLAYIMVMGVAYVFLTRAAGVLTHQPPPVFWLGAILLAVFVYQYAVMGIQPREKWLEEKTVSFPLGWKHTLGLLLWSLIPLFLQYKHVQQDAGGWPWYLPMIAWGIGLVWLTQALANRSITRRFHLPNLLLSYGSVGEDYEETYHPLTKPPFRLTKEMANKMVFGICVLATALYMINATAIPTDVHGDEAEVAMHGIKVRDSGNWNFFNLGWYNIPNLFYLIPAWVMWLFGDNLFGIRMSGALTGLAGVPVFYLLARRMMWLTPAVLATFLFATGTYVVHFSRIGIGYNQTTLLTLAGLYAFVRSIQDRDSRFAILAGAVAGIGMMSYQATHLLLPLMIGSAALLWFIRIVTLRDAMMQLCVLLFGFWMLVSPLAGNYMQAPELSVSRANSVTLLSERGREMIQSEYPGTTNMNTIVQKQIEHSLLAPIAYRDRSPYLINAQYGGILDPLPAILFTAGCFILLTRPANPAALLLLFWILSTLIIGSALTNRAPSYQRLAGLAPFLFLAAAPVLHGALRQMALVGRWSSHIRLGFTGLILTLILIMGMNRYFHQIQSVPQMLDEWTRIARYLDDAGPTRYTYFFGPPHVWFEYGTIQFLAQEAKGENVNDPEQFMKQTINRRGPVTFLLVRTNRQHLHQLRTLYPGGKEEHWFNSRGQDPFITYTVNF